MKIQKTIEKLELKPGDFLVITVHGIPAQEEIERTGNIVRDGLKGCGFAGNDIGILVKTDDISLAVYRECKV